MGVIRLILAISVVIGHSSPIFGVTLVGGQAAVQAFYIISGFYMALILKEKYINNNSSYRLFISNRLLRLFPIYWVVLILIFFVGILSYFLTDGNIMIGFDPYLEYFNDLSFSSILFLSISNIFFLFQDLIMFMGIDLSKNSFYLTTNFKDSSPMLYEFLLVPQAWTIGLEIMFYLIVPILIKFKTRTIIIIAILSIILRVYLINIGLDDDPWSYRFFPTEFVFFLSGIIAYEIFKRKIITSKKCMWIIFISILLITMFYPLISVPGKKYIYLLLFFLALPSIFDLSKKWKKDRIIGELSYPVYISHYFILNILISIGVDFNQGLILVFLTLILSFILNELISKNIENFRQSRVKI